MRQPYGAVGAKAQSARDVASVPSGGFARRSFLEAATWREHAVAAVVAKALDERLVVLEVAHDFARVIARRPRGRKPPPAPRCVDMAGLYQSARP
jgi:hypothetical protein